MGVISEEPQKDQKIDLEIGEDGSAKDIYVLKDVAALALTFFLGFIGTFLSRLLISKHSAGEAAIPALGHFALLFLLFIPILGWIAYFGGTIYIMIKNYKLAVSPKK